ncbi:MAG: antitoxin [Pseudomonadota bacterium]|nr:antitoxin [Pseudomonadota bacterium]
MIKTQVQLPDELYREAKRVAREREMSLAEVMRRGVEYMIHVYPPLQSTKEWSPPNPRHLGNFLTSPDDWRELGNVSRTESEET